MQLAGEAGWRCEWSLRRNTPGEGKGKRPSVDKGQVRRGGKLKNSSGVTDGLTTEGERKNNG